jgi:hypothetical protein
VGFTGPTIRCSSFVKDEHYEGWKYPRLINSRSDQFKVFIGPTIKAMEHLVYSHLPEFIKHVPVR